MERLAGGDPQALSTLRVEDLEELSARARGSSMRPPDWSCGGRERCFAELSGRRWRENIVCWATC